METLLPALVRHAAAAPDRVAFHVWQGGRYRTLSRADFLELSRRLAGLLATALPAERGGVVFIALRHGPLQQASFVAGLLAGLVPSFLPFPSEKQSRDVYLDTHAPLFARTRPVAIVTYPELADALSAIAPGAVVLPLDERAFEGGDPLPLDRPFPAADAIALLQHSSGTTGLKKGVALTYGHVARQTGAYARAAGLDDRSVVASWLPLYHDMGLLTALLVPLSLGVPVVAIDPFEWVREPLILLRAAAIFRATHLWLPNFAFQHILNAASPVDRFDLRASRAFIGCSEPNKPATLRAFADRFGPDGATLDKMATCYAMAETTFAVSQSPLGREPRVFGTGSGPPLVSNGPLLDGIEVGIRGPDGRVRTGEGGPGEILVRGAFVFDGYHANEAATEAAFVDGWYRTGDLGFVRDGEIYVSGRIKDLVVVHGRNYYAHDIEEIVSAVPPVVPGRVVAIGVPDEATGSEEVLVLAELRAEDASAGEGPDLRRRIKRAIHDRLELMPREVAFVPHGWLAKTTSGKISRSANLARFRNDVCQRTGSAA